MRTILSCLFCVSILRCTFVCGEWLHITQQMVEVKDIIEKLEHISITSCQLRCKMNERCFSIGTVERKMMGEMMKCFLIGEEVYKYDGKDIGSTIEMHVVKEAVRNLHFGKAATAFPVTQTPSGVTPNKSDSVVFISANASSIYRDNTGLWGPTLSWSGRSTNSTGFYHSKREDNPWLQIELQPVLLDGLTVINRKDSYGERLNNLEVRGGMIPSGLLNEVIGNLTGPGVTGEEYRIPFGRTVMVAYITFQIKGTNQVLQINGIKVEVGKGHLYPLVLAETQPQHNKIVGAFDTMEKEFIISLELKPMANYYDNYHNVFHFTTTGKDCCGRGDRVPALWLLHERKIHISYDVSNIPTHIYNSGPVNINQYASVMIKQTKDITDIYRYTIIINGVTVHSIVNTNPLRFEGVKVYVSNPWWPVALCKIRNFILQPLSGPPSPPNNTGALSGPPSPPNNTGALSGPPSPPNNTGGWIKQILISNQTTISRDNLIFTLDSVGKEYKVVMECYPMVNEHNRNIIHFTIGNDGSNYGDRIPAIWYYDAHTIIVASAVSGNVNFFRGAQGISLNTWHTVEVTQEKVGANYIFSVVVNGNKVVTVVNTQPQTFHNVKVYAGDPWYDALNGYIRKLNFYKKPDA